MYRLPKLKQQSGRNILVVGSGMLSQPLIQHDLVDAYRVLIFPVIVGQGKHLSDAQMGQTRIPDDAVGHGGRFPFFR
ncbi:MAG: dihydrofolate reductase family protein [Anaerolineae bacterium]|nr:dihydrofolate reductase family protein [Anaerolineae bacterium]